ncbi:MAG TPA: hypothetical protein VNA66_09940 [Gammaproteobacteria bacterium]|nr:hypothetical protein [Gammaproteobacteria bacterium]
MYNLTDMALDELHKRALIAYLKGDDADEQPTKSETRKAGGKKYVLLSKGARLLACYRVRNDGKLKRLIRIPHQFC